MVQRKLLHDGSRVELCLLHEDNQSILTNQFIRTSKEFVAEHPISVSVQNNIFEFVFISARQSIGFHLEAPSPNIFKEAGHLCYWICKHRPFLPKPHFTLNGMAMISQMVGSEKAHKLATTRLKAAQQLPVNELIALGTTIKIISENLYRQYCKELKIKKIDQVTFDRKVEFLRQNTERFDYKKMIKLASSFHMHTYSSRTMATLFECYFEQ